LNFYTLTTLLVTLTMTTLFSEKVEITSDSMNAENMKKQVQFMGNVKIKQVKNWLNADKVIVYFNDNNETNKYEAIGSVVFEFKKENAFYKGHGDKVVYFPNKSQYILTGNAVIDDEMNKRHVSGDNIEFDMITGNAKVKGKRSGKGKVKPVKFIFDMESK